MANKVGRPTNNVREERMKLEYNPIMKVPKEGLLYYGYPDKFSDEGEFKSCLASILQKSLTSPIQPVLINFGVNYWVSDSRYVNQFYNYYINAKNYISDTVYNAACSAAMELIIVYDHFIKEVNSSIKYFAYYFTMNLDLRKINHNWSIVYQIISDIHYRLFNRFLGVYILEIPNYSKSPIATLHIFISNPSIYPTYFLSSSLRSMKSEYTMESKDIVNEVFKNCKYNDNGIPVLEPIIIDREFATEKFLPSDYNGDIKEPNRTWYEDLYGNSIYNTYPISNYKSNTRITKIGAEYNRNEMATKLIRRDFNISLKDI